MSFPDYVDLKDETKDFILSCLAKVPSLRPNIATLANHSFFGRKRAGSSLNLYEDVEAIL